MLNYIASTKPSQRTGLARLLGVAASTAAFALFASGCVGSADVDAEYAYSHPTVWVEAPPEIRAYPRYYYRGSYAYLVDNRWYYDTPSGWVLFRAEPRELAERRVYIERRSQRPPRSRRDRPRYYDERRAPASPEERGRRYYPR